MGSKSFKIVFNRRRFMKRAAMALAATTSLGLVAELPATSLASAWTQPADGDPVDALMRAANQACNEIKGFLEHVSDELGAAKEEAAKAAESANACSNARAIVHEILNSVIVAIVNVVVTLFSYGASVSSLAVTVSTTVKIREFIEKVDGPLKDADAREADVRKQNKMTKELEAAIRKARGLAENAKDAAAACNVYGHIAKDRAVATKLVDAVRTQKLEAVAEVLKAFALGRAVGVGEARQDKEFFMSVRLGTLTHCLSTSSGCQGKSFSITK